MKLGTHHTDESKSKMAGKNHHNFGKHLSDDVKQKLSESLLGSKNHNFGKHFSEETRKKIGDAQRGRSISDEHKQKISVANVGKVISVETRRKIGEAHKGKEISEEMRQKLRDVNTGKHHSEETRKKISETLKKNATEIRRKNKSENGKGRVLSDDTRRKISESKKGKPFSELHRKHLSESHKGEKHQWFGKKLPNETRRKMSEAQKGKIQSIETRKKLSILNQGELSNLWKGGVSFLPYCFRFNKHRRISTRHFFNNTCVACGSHVSECKTNLHVHHIDHDKNQGCAGKPFNLIPLCQPCHARERFNQEEYKSYINRTLNEGFKWGIWNHEQYELEVMYPEQSEVEMTITETTASIPAGV